MVSDTSRGRRTPARHIYCLIDFDVKGISIENDTEILSYELWNEEGESLIVAYPEDEQMVEFMSGLKGTYQLRLVTEECLYVGYVEL